MVSAVERMQSRNVYGRLLSCVIVAVLLSSALPPALHAEGLPEDNTLIEIVVIGDKFRKTLQETATSVVVLDSDTLRERAGLNSLDEVVLRLPNITDTGGGLASAVRGVDGTGAASGGTAFLGGTRSRLNVQVDGRPLTFNELAYGDAAIYDVAQVEVLRGAQSSLQGRNAIAGTIAIQTADPTYEPEYGTRIVGGSNEFYQGAGYFSGPIVDDQVAVRFAVDVQGRDSFVEMTPFEAEQNPEEKRLTTGRAKILIEPDNLKNLRTVLSVSYHEARLPYVEFVVPPFDEFVSATVPYFGPGEPVMRTDATAGTVQSTLDISENVSLEAFASYADFGFTRTVPPGAGIASQDGREFIVEPRIRVNLLGDRIDWLSGLHYFDSEQEEEIDIAGGLAFDDSTETLGLFTEAIFDVTELFGLQLGFRYEEEQRRRNDTAGPIAVNLDQKTEVFLPKFGAYLNITDDLRVGALVSKGYSGGGAGFSFAGFLDYAYDEETVWTYETYIRSQVGNTLTINANAFYSDYDDLQVFVNNGIDFFVVNLADVKTYGAEASITFEPLEGLQLSADVGLLETEVDDDNVLAGDELPRAPGLTSNLAATYTGMNGITFSVDAQYSDGYQSRIENLPEEFVDSYWVANAQLTYDFSDNLRLFVSCTNIFDNIDETFIFSNLAPFNIASVIHPRRVFGGIELSFD